MRTRLAGVVSMVLLAAAVTTAAAAPQPPIAAQEPVVRSFTTSIGDDVPYRVGWYGGGAYCVGPVECPDWINRAFATD